MSEPVTVLIVEDDPPTRERIAAAMRSASEIVVVGTAGSVREGLDIMSRHVPRVLLTDIGLPDGSGTELIRSALERDATVLPMVITVFGDEAHVVKALEAGALGYLLKDGSNEQLLSSVRELLAGGSPISPAIARYLLKRFSDPPAAATAEPPASAEGAPAKQATPAPAEGAPANQVTPLSAREKEVLTYISKGFTYKEIAELLGLSTHTVTTHVRHIYRKLAVSSQTEAVFEAVQLGLLQLD